MLLCDSVGSVSNIPGRSMLCSHTGIICHPEVLMLALITYTDRVNWILTGQIVDLWLSKCGPGTLKGSLGGIQRVSSKPRKSLISLLFNALEMIYNRKCLRGTCNHRFQFLHHYIPAYRADCYTFNTKSKILPCGSLWDKNPIILGSVALKCVCLGDP